MWLIFLEALIALLVLVLIVWWTMFAGRKKGEPQRRDARSEGGDAPSARSPNTHDGWRDSSHGRNRHRDDERSGGGDHNDGSDGGGGGNGGGDGGGDGGGGD
jgi:hypothetical protein